MKTLLSFAAVAAIVSTSALADNTTPAVTPERSQQIGAFVSNDHRVKPFIDLALSKAGIDQAKDLRIEKLDCTKHPVMFGQANTAYCAIELDTVYGWYADPTLITGVKGFIRQALIATGELEAGDFNIIDVEIKTPLPTGLE